VLGWSERCEQGVDGEKFVGAEQGSSAEPGVLFSAMGSSAARTHRCAVVVCMQYIDEEIVN
jgi:hypothetical protein